MRRLLLAAAVLVIVGQAQGLEAYEFRSYDDSRPMDIFRAGNDANFRLNASDDQDYNITITDPDGNVEVLDEPMEKLQTGSYHVYRYNFSTDGIQAGDWSAYVNMTINEESTLASTGFHIANETPDFYPVRHQQEGFVGENVTVTANVTDSGDNINTVVMELADQSIEMSLIDSGTDVYSTYQAEANLTSTGGNELEITATDSDGRQGIYQNVILGESSSERSTSFDVYVDYGCDVELRDYRPPGDGITTYGAPAFFSWFAENIGDIDSNISSTLRVDYQGDERWEPGDEVGVDGNDSYTENFSVGPENVPNSTYKDDNGTVVYNNETLVQPFNVTPGLPSGWYLSRTNFTFECADVYSDGEDGVEKNYSDTVNYTVSRYRNFKLVNASGGVSNEGNQTSNKTLYQDVNDTGLESNETLEQDANQTGEEGSEVEGNNDQPGTTPQPEPEPEPEPDPVPMLSMDIEPLEQRHTIRRGQFQPVNLSIANEGSVELQQMSIEPQTSQFEEDWNISSASVAQLSPNETVYRQVLVRPSAGVTPGNYVVPVVGSDPENELDIDYFTVEVPDQPVFRSGLVISEAPRQLELESNATRPMPVLVENTGRSNLTNVSVEIQNMEDCGTYSGGRIERLGVGDSGPLNITLDTADVTESCNITLIASSEEGAYSFTEVGLTVQPPEGLIPRQYQVPFISIAWTTLLAAFAVFRRKYDMSSAMFKIPFILLVVGETMIFIYMLVDYYQLVSASFLPF